MLLLDIYRYGHDGDDNTEKESQTEMRAEIERTKQRAVTVWESSVLSFSKYIV